MTVSLALQYAVIGLAVAVSAAFVMRTQFPAATRRLRVACALPLLREGRPAWLQAIGRRVAPRATSAATACGGCNTCDHETP